MMDLLAIHQDILLFVYITGIGLVTATYGAVLAITEQEVPLFIIGANALLWPILVIFALIHIPLFLIKRGLT